MPWRKWAGEWKNSRWFYLTAFGCHSSARARIAFLPPQRDWLHISIRAHGRESSLRMLWWRSWRQKTQWGIVTCKSVMCPHCCLSDKVLPETLAPPLSPILNSRHQPESEDREAGTHGEVSVEVVFPVEKRLLVYGAVESQSCQHCGLHASFVQDLEADGDVTGWGIEKGLFIFVKTT